jgi:hypothetical protein
MAHVSVVLVAAFAAWGPVAPPSRPAPPPPIVSAPVAPVPAPVAPVVSDAETPGGAPSIAPAIIVRGPIDARATPLVAVAAAAPPPQQRPLYKRWQFWAIAGGLLTAAIVLTVAETRPGPPPYYTGNAPPYSIGLP